MEYFICKCCQMDKNTKREIANRSLDETNSYKLLEMIEVDYCEY